NILSSLGKVIYKCLTWNQNRFASSGYKLPSLAQSTEWPAAAEACVSARLWMQRNGVFGQRTAQNLRQLGTRNSEYARGSLLFCVTAARFPAFAEYATRLRSLSRSAAPFLADEAARCRWADAGLFLPADEAATGAVRCFHCGCRLPVRPGGPTDEPLRLHEQLGGEQCELLTLLKVAHGMLSERHDRVVATSAKLRRALAKLSSDLLERRSMLGLVESFGFARSSVLYCACRHFMTRGGQLACRPGDLIEMICEFEELQPDWGHVIDVEAVLSDCATLNESGASGERQQRPALEQQRPALEQQRPALEQQRPALEQQGAVAMCRAATVGGSSLVGVARQPSVSPDADQLKPNELGGCSEKCLLCRERTRDHVTLPCAHFLLCHGCVSSRTDCPQCGGRILASLRAFIA
ncbi:hypothetical protein BOX15_Mlig014808g1, partial [Macrostomum lignano]